MTNAFGPGLLGTICTLDYWILGLQLAGKMNVFVWLMKRINIHCKNDIFKEFTYNCNIQYEDLLPIQLDSGKLLCEM